MTQQDNPHTDSWTKAWLIIALPAIALVAYGLFSSVAQARALSKLRIENADQAATALCRSAEHQIRDTLAQILSRAAGHFQAGRRIDPFSGRRPHPWLGDIFVWDARLLTRWPGPDPPTAVHDSETAKRIIDIFENTHSRSTPESARVVHFATIVHHGRKSILGYISIASPPATPFMVGVTIDSDRIATSLLDSHFSKDKHLKLVRRGEHGLNTKVHTISPAAEPYVIVLDQQFLNAQLHTALRPVLLYTTIAALFLCALGLTVRKFIRLVQHELALTSLKSDFIASVSHELKTPLALIHMFSEMLRENRVSSEDKKQEYYSIIFRESARLSLMIDNILDFSRIEAGRKEFHTEPTDIGKVVRDTCETYRFELDDKGFEHSISIDPNLPTIDADPNAIAQVMVNLIGNAIKYSTGEKTLEIKVTAETRRDRHGVLITVTDSGIGVKPEDRAHLFDGFYRAQDDRVRKVRGAGLGLSLVKRIVDAHHGIVDVESRLVKGSTFRVFLPQTQSNQGGEDIATRERDANKGNANQAKG